MTGVRLYLIEILHQTTTMQALQNLAVVLYLIEILHQTTTARAALLPLRCCILSKFYIKPQPSARVRELLKGCILSKFYIKPQQRVRHNIGHSVVSYRNSTSNHNLVMLRVRTSALYLIEILHQTTTSPSIPSLAVPLYLIEILHQTTTPQRL